MQPTQHLNATAALALSIELSGKSWRIAATDGHQANPAQIKIELEQRWDRLRELLVRIEGLQKRWGLPADAAVTVIYEAGQDGFWIARALQRLGVRVLVVDPASVPVARHARRRKTDRLDALKLLEVLRAWLRGECSEVHMVRIPTEEAEAQRLLSRRRGLLQKEVGQHRDRIRKLLLLHGCADTVDDSFPERLMAGEVRRADGRPLPQELWDWLLLECERLDLARRQLASLEKTLMQQLPEAVQRSIAVLAQLKGVGWVGAMRLVLELFWRDFANRRQVAACVGLTPQPYDSGESHTDQGISKQGNRRVRALLIEMAWDWLRYQPGSDLAQWFAKRTAGDHKRGKRVAIVAVARRLVIDLWRYLRQGVIPPGAQLKAATH
jgi:transposase